MKRTSFFLAAALTFAAASAPAQDPPSDERLLLRDVPADVGPVAKIAADSAPGERLLIRGTVYRADGMTPAAGTLIYFYQTNATGTYEKRGDEDRSSFAWWHGFTRGFAKTGADGRYTLDTIRPAPYPAMDAPAHIHSSLLASPEAKFQGIADFVFTDDPLLNDAFWRETEEWGAPRYGGVRLAKIGARWEGTRDLYLKPQPEDGPQFGPEIGWPLGPAPEKDVVVVLVADASRAVEAAPLIARAKEAVAPYPVMVFAAGEAEDAAKLASPNPPLPYDATGFGEAPGSRLPAPVSLIVTRNRRVFAKCADASAADWSRVREALARAGQ